MPLSSPPLGKPQAPTMTKSFDYDYEVWCQILWNDYVRARVALELQNTSAMRAMKKRRAKQTQATQQATK
jgi:hypothetical protein